VVLRVLGELLHNSERAIHQWRCATRNTQHAKSTNRGHTSSPGSLGSTYLWLGF
jgi:hypothetical protein